MMTDRELQSLRNLGGFSEEAADEIAALRAEVAGLREDAERWRYVRHGNMSAEAFNLMTEIFELNADSSLDKAIDILRGAKA